jgi:hypothetical protein
MDGNYIVRIVLHVVVVLHVETFQTGMKQQRAGQLRSNCNSRKNGAIRVGQLPSNNANENDAPKGKLPESISFCKKTDIFKILMKQD